jgi:hypothetical protein
MHWQCYHDITRCIPIWFVNLLLATLQFVTLHFDTLQLVTITTCHLTTYNLVTNNISPPLHLATITFCHHYILPPLHFATITFCHHYILPLLHFFFLLLLLLAQWRLTCWDFCFCMIHSQISWPRSGDCGGAGFEPGTAASSVWCRPVALANWATTSP